MTSPGAAPDRAPMRHETPTGIEGLDASTLGGLPTGGEADHGDDPRDDAPVRAPAEHGGPYFGRLLVVLLLAVAFCAFITWLLSHTMAG